MGNKEILSVDGRVRVSVGTAGFLGLLNLHSDAEPTTAYLMTYTQEGCRGNCAFCPQARESSASRELLSRVAWPHFLLDAVADRIKAKVREGRLQRVCIQSLNYDSFFLDLSRILQTILLETSVPISVSCPPLERQQFEYLKKLGVDRIGVPLDAATPDIFDKIKGGAVKSPYRWESHLNALGQAVNIFGADRVSTHIIVGLGETERDAVETVQRMRDIGVFPSLFAFTPVTGTKLGNSNRVKIGHYRRVQLAAYLIVRGVTSSRHMKYDSVGRIIDFGIDPVAINEFALLGDPFRTSGCPGCNRPYYTESPRGPLYNYPRTLKEEEKLKALAELRL